MIDWQPVFLWCEIVKEYYDVTIRLQIKFYQSKEKIAINCKLGNQLFTVVNLLTVIDWLQVFLQCEIVQECNAVIIQVPI